MTVVLSAICDRCGAEHRPDRPVRSFQPGAVRARAAFHGWEQLEEHGVTLDVCPRCLQEAVPAQQQMARRVLVGAAPQAPGSPAPPVHRTLLEVEVCDRCADGEHLWCSGCECQVCA